MMRYLSLSVIIIAQSSFAITFDQDLIRPWSKIDKSAYPTPLLAVFKNEDKSKVLIFVGDHHVDQKETFKYLEYSFQKYKPAVVIVEALENSKGFNPKKWVTKYSKKSSEQLLKESWIGPNAARLAILNSMKFIGGEPSIKEEMSSSYLKSKGYSENDILYTRVLQRLPYRRDDLKLNENNFFKYAHSHYKVQMSLNQFILKFKNWYKTENIKSFIYSKIKKEDTDVNCLENDSRIQKISCDINIFRDRYLVSLAEKYLNDNQTVLIAYGAGHFVQEVPSYTKAFGKPPELINLNDQ